MNCEHCQEHLLDLVYDELLGAEADALRAHMEGCADCRLSFEKLGRTQRLLAELPMLEAPAPSALAIMAAARAHVGAELPEVRSEAGARDEGLWASFLKWAGSFAMGPQVAMATIMLLVVSLGLWYFPNQPRPPEGTGSTVMSPDDEGEVGPSATLAPADPLDLDLDERTGRLVSADQAREQEEARLARQAEAPAAGPAIPASDEQGRGRGAVGGAERSAEGSDGAGRVVAGALDTDDDGNLEQQNQGARRPLTLDVDSLADLGAEGSVRPGSGSRAYEPRAAPEAEASEARGSGAGSVASSGSAAPSSATRSPFRAEATPAAPTQQAPEPAPTDAREAYARGMQRYQQGDFWGAAEDFNRVYRNPAGQESLVPSALHHLARSYRRAGRCNMAEPQYRALMSRYPSYSGTPRAIMELADCYRILGRLSDARATFEQAQRHASVATEARRELLRVRQMERAANRVDSDQAAAEEAY
jgi:TolA-binding protein